MLVTAVRRLVNRAPSKPASGFKPTSANDRRSAARLLVASRQLRKSCASHLGPARTSNSPFASSSPFDR
eukprot:6589784-Prymnesium_polylepis.2